MVRALYQVLLHLLALIALPRFLWQRFFHKKYRESLRERLGVAFPPVAKKRPVYWIHAVSVGETRAIIPLVRRLRQALPEANLILSNVTETGHAEAKRALPEVDRLVYLPFDFSYIVEPIVTRIAPNYVLLAEGDLWANFLHAAKRSKAKIAIVNGKISERSLRWYRRFPSFARLFFKQIDLFCLQGEVFRKRFLTLGISDAQIVVTGNLKLDAEATLLPPEKRDEWRKKLGLKANDLVVVCGSTHDPEEIELVQILSTVRKRFPRLKVLLVPRHPERFPVVAEMLASEGVTFRKFSDATSEHPNASVILVDKMGILRTLYQLADVALVCGTFTDKVGGHNLLEPCAYGVPVLYGPSIFAQPDLHALVQRYGVGVQVTPETLAQTVIDLLADDKRRQNMGARAKELFSEARGATERTWQALLDAHFVKNS